MKRILIIAMVVLCFATLSHAQMSEKTGPAAAEISPGDSIYKSKAALTQTRKRPATLEQRKAAAAAAEQDSTSRPPSSTEIQMKRPTDTPATVQVK